MNDASNHTFPEFDRNSRLLLIAPHPDDEALGCGIILQRAARAQAGIRVVYATDGDNNPWPQRWISRKWRLTALDRKSWGDLRRAEALASLQILGVSRADVSFLGWPDQGLTSLLMRGCSATVARFVTLIEEYSPTHLVMPSEADSHPDHNALAVIVRLALARLRRNDHASNVWTYAIHGRNRRFFDRAVAGSQSEMEVRIKRHAIRCHQTQLRLSRKRFLAYADRVERFAPLSPANHLPANETGPSLVQNGHGTRVMVKLGAGNSGQNQWPLHVCGYDRNGAFRTVVVRPSGNGNDLKLCDALDGKRLGTARCRTEGREIDLPIDLFCSSQPIFMKSGRRRMGFFDESGWIPFLAAESGPARTASAEVPIAMEAGPTSTPGKSLLKLLQFRWSWQPWTIAFAAVLIWLGLSLCRHIDRPWIGALDYNGAVWSQSAHNILRAGLTETAGASSGFYFGPLPIPAWGYYLHHPPLLHLAITVLFLIFGEHEWAARLLPIGCSLATVVLLWVLVRSCAGTRIATLAAAIFACLPMELRYGRMVNFEPVVLMLIIGALLCLRYWRVSSDGRWRYGALTLILIGLWVDWAMHLFVLALCLCWLLRFRRTRSFGITLLIVATLSAGLYLFRIQALRPDAWQNLTHTLVVRLGSSGTDTFTEADWSRRIGQSLLGHFLPAGLGLAVAGAFLALRASRHDPNYRFLFRSCLSIFAMDVLFVGLFQNDSYIHQYIAFYFLAPVAVLAGIALDRLIVLLNAMSRNHRARWAEVSACALLLLLAHRGAAQATELERQFHILDYRTAEPANLIPELGEAIQKHFPPGTEILCNFLPEYGPQFAYYAQRDILNNLSEYRFWQSHLTAHNQRIGGVVWITPKTKDLVAKLPPGSKQFVNFGDLSFCLWEPKLIVSKPAPKGL